MRMFQKSGVFVILSFVLLIQCKEEDDNNDVFVPTKEWQTVRKGQKIPKGLHVRINLETSQTEAKLLDDDQTTNALSAIPQPEEKTTLEEALKNIKGDDLLNPDDLKNIKDKFRSYADLKRSLGDLNLTPKIDAEVIADLLARHKKSSEVAELLTILEDLDFLAHQYDNANEFVRQNGFPEVIYKNLNSTNAEVKKSTLKLMSAVLQNNANPKIHALESGAIGVLSRMIAFESDPRVKQRALTSLGTLLRSFPAAQKKFVDSGGLATLERLFDEADIGVQVRLVTMMSDLIEEHEWAEVDEKLRKYYVDFDFKGKVLEHDWCSKLNKLLLGLLITDQEDHDSVEKCLTAMRALKGHCGGSYERELLVTLKGRYEKMSAMNAEVEGDFFDKLKRLCDDVLHQVHDEVKTEL